LLNFWNEPFVKNKTRTAKSNRAATLAALRKENERALTGLIRRRLALPIEKRLNFLRVRRPGGGSHL